MEEKKRRAISADELMDRLNSDPNYRRRIEEKGREREKRIRETREALENVIADLRGIGFEVNSLDELRRSRTKYRAAIPVLLYWLPRVSLPAPKESIVRALSVPWAKPEAGIPLIKEFERTPIDHDRPEWQSLRWAIGNAIEVLAEPPLMDKLFKIVSNRDNGKAREMFVLALAKIPNPKSVSLLIELLGDEQVAGHAIKALGKLKAQEALPLLPRFVESPKSWIRNEAKKAISAIMKQAE